MSAKQTIHDVLVKSDGKNQLSSMVDILIVSIIACNTILIIIETIPSIADRYANYLYALDIFIVALFTIEYVLRIWSITATKKFRHPVTGRVKYMLTPMALVDLLAILPFFLPSIIPIDLRVLRVVRVLRLTALLKLARYSQSIGRFGKVIKDRRGELITTGFIVFILLIISSTLMYHVEHEVQPEAFSSIPAAMWWGVSTLTTVGYGDIVPVTSWGKFFGAIISLLGIGLFVLPAGILSSGFAHELHKIRKTKGNDSTCPHCGKNVRLST